MKAIIDGVTHEFCPIEQLEQDLIDAHDESSRADHRFLKRLREFDLRQGWKLAGNTDCAGWLGWRCRISRNTANEKLRVANALWNLPQIDAEFEKADLSYSQVRAVTRVATADNETELLDKALSLTAGDLERYVARRRNAAPESTAQAQRRLAGRSLIKSTDADGNGTITVQLPAAELELVMAALEKVAASLPADEERPLFAKGADALVEMARGAVSAETGAGAGSGSNGARGSQGYEVVVHIDAEALAGKGGQSDLPLPVVQRLCCDGAIRAMTVKDGVPVDVGRRERTVSRALKRALYARDRTCRFPGCHHERFLDAHHIEEWARGGESVLENTLLLCSHHHALVHEGGFRVEKWPAGGVYFMRPDGRILESPPCPVSAEVGTDCVAEPAKPFLSGAGRRVPNTAARAARCLVVTDVTTNQQRASLRAGESMSVQFRDPQPG